MAPVRCSAEGILRQIRPYVSAAYRLDKNDLSGALEIAREIIRDSGSDKKDMSAAYHLWGLVRVTQRKYSEAIAKSQRAINLDPKSQIAYVNWAMRSAKRASTTRRS
jgi:tetratricopeptide (TPR) repeat protein